MAEALCTRRDASVGFERTLLSLYVAHISPSALDPSSSSLNLSRSSLKEQGDGAGRGGGGRGGGGKDTFLSQAPAEPTRPPASMQANGNAANMHKETPEGGAAEREAIGRYNLLVAAQRKAEREAKERYDALLEENAKREREGMARYNVLLARLRVEVEERDAEIRKLRGEEGGDVAVRSGRGAMVEDAHRSNGDDHGVDDDSDVSDEAGGGERKGGPGVSFSSRSGRSGGREGARMSVMRHGQREDEVNEDWYSLNPKRPYDPPLTEKGKAQARAAGKVLAGRGVSVIVSSPFLRCLETAFEVIKGLEEGGSDTQDTVLYVDYGLSEVLSERNMKGVKPSPLCPSDLNHEV